MGQGSRYFTGLDAPRLPCQPSPPPAAGLLHPALVSPSPHPLNPSETGSSVKAPVSWKLAAHSRHPDGLTFPSTRPGSFLTPLRLLIGSRLAVCGAAKSCLFFLCSTAGVLFSPSRLGLAVTAAQPSDFGIHCPSTQVSTRHLFQRVRLHETVHPGLALLKKPGQSLTAHLKSWEPRA